MPEAFEAVFPATTVQARIVHLIRHSLRYVPRCSYDHVVEELRSISKASDACAGLAVLEAFEERWSEQLPVSASRNSWEHVRDPVPQLRAGGAAEPHGA